MEELLNVGDVVYEKHNIFGYVFRGTVERVTKTQAILKGGGTKLKRVGYNNFFGVIGSNNFFSKETPEIKAAYQRKVLLSAIKSINFDALTNEQLSAILSIAKA